jgi:outer membrane protein TolC
MAQNKTMARKKLIIGYLVINLFFTTMRPLWAQEPRKMEKEIEDYTRGEWFPKITAPYRAFPLPPVEFTNSDRIRRLVRGGKLYLSLSDAIALALENNLDIAVSRYDLMMAAVDLFRTQSGAAARGIAGATIPSGLFGAGAIGGGIGPGAAAIGTSGAGGAGTGGVSGTSVGAASTFDPIFSVDYSANHARTPLNITSLVGAEQLTQTTHFARFGVSQYFHTGTTYFASFIGAQQSSTSANVLFSPQIVTTLALGFNQHLLNGFSFKPNTRFIRVAKNNLRISNVTFKQQVINVVSRVINAYWDLVYAQEALKVAQHSMEMSRKLLGDNKAKVEAGTMAAIEITRAESEMATSEQNLIQAETGIQQQEQGLRLLIAKSLDPDLLRLSIEPTDRFPEPRPEDIPDELAAVKAALASRPEIEQANLNVVNNRIAVEFTHNALLPTLDVFGLLTGAGLSGNRLSPPNPQMLGVPRAVITRNGFFQALNQTLGYDFPTYAFGFTLQVPIRNRTAKADYARALLETRQAETNLNRLKNQVLQDVSNALIALTQSRARVQAAQRGVTLAQKTFDAEQLRLEAGVSTPFQVIQTQRDFIAAQANQAQALSSYAKALVEMARTTGSTLEKANIEVEEAKLGEVTRAPRIF